MSHYTGGCLYGAVRIEIADRGVDPPSRVGDSGKLCPALKPGTEGQYFTALWQCWPGSAA
jgi:hypothetical protein